MLEGGQIVTDMANGAEVYLRMWAQAQAARTGGPAQLSLRGGEEAPASRLSSRAHPRRAAPTRS